MPDDKTNREVRDRDRINVNEAYEIEYWTGKLDVTPDELREAVKRVGVMVKDVEKELER